MVKRKNRLYVFMNGLLVGTLNKSEQGALSFSYADSWLDQAGSRPLSLSLPLRRDEYSGDVVFNFFDNLLPDNASIRARVQKRFQIRSSHPFELLAAIGGDCIGAIQLSLSEYPENVKDIKAKPLTESQLASLLRSYQVAPLGMSVEVDDFRVSLAGAQEKTAVLWHDNQWQLPLGTTPTSHILKLPIGLIHYNQIDLSESVRNEWLCLRLCQGFGLPVPATQILQVEDLSVLAVERFDRRWANDRSWLMRLPQEDMCQALGYSPALKYEAEGGPSITAIMRLLLGSQQAIEDRTLFFRAQIIYWLLAASDGHAKNFGIFLEAGNRYRLTPFYDVLSVHPLMGKGIASQKVRMAMALQGKNRHYHWSKIMPRHFVSTADACGFSTEFAQRFLNEVLVQAESVVATIANTLDSDFPTHISDPIFNGVLNLAKRFKD